MFKSKKVRVSLAVAIIIIVAVGIFRWRDFYALATSVIDSFTTTDNVADTWNTTVDTANGEVKLATKSCDTDTWDCTDNTVCSNSFGDGDYIIVAKTDVATAQQWKAENTACDQPECGADGGQDGDNLVADNTISFADYPARDACKTLGGRLPTKTELNCIYLNQATFGDNFATGYYWSSTENSTTVAWSQYFSNGNQSTNDNKTNSHSVRCVLGW